MTKIEETRTRYELLKAVNKLNINIWRMLELQKKAYDKAYPKPFSWDTYGKYPETWEGDNYYPRYSYERR